MQVLYIQKQKFIQHRQSISEVPVWRCSNIHAQTEEQWPSLSEHPEHFVRV
jgi:hypothetical protein